MKQELTPTVLQTEAAAFAKRESEHSEPSLYGVTDGKAIGTYLEHKFIEDLTDKYYFIHGNSARGIDFPDLLIDIKVTSIRQPQSSCPFSSARQKIFGLGYSLMIFAYEKEDRHDTETSCLHIQHVIFVDSSRTADYQTTSGICHILQNDGNKDDLLAFFCERMLPVDSIEATAIADELLKHPPKLGYLTISNALQWRLQYSRVIEKAGIVEGVVRVN